MPAESRATKCVAGATCVTDRYDRRSAPPFAVCHGIGRGISSIFYPVASPLRAHGPVRLVLSPVHRRLCGDAVLAGLAYPQPARAADAASRRSAGPEGAGAAPSDPLLLATGMSRVRDHLHDRQPAARQAPR